MTRLLTVVAIFLAGCAREERPSEAPARRGADAAPVRSEGAPSPLTGEVLRGLTVEGALRIADRVHPYLALARAEVEASEGRVVQAGLFPSTAAILRMQQARVGNGSTFRQAEYVAGLLQTLPISGRLGAAERIQERDRERIMREAEVRRVAVHGRIRGAFATAVYFERVRRAHRNATAYARKGVEVAAARVRAGEAPPEEVARVEIELSRAQIEADRAENDRQQAILELVAAIGAHGLRIESLEGSIEAAFAVLAIEELSRRLEEHPSLLAALAKVSVEDARIDLAERLRIPDMYVELYYRRLQVERTDSIDAGFGFLIPFFDRSQGRIREARAHRAAAVAQVQSTRLELEAQLRGTHAKLSRALKASRVLREDVLPRAERVLKAGQARYAAGHIGLTDVLSVCRERVLVEIAYLQALREALEAWASLLPFLREK